MLAARGYALLDFGERQRLERWGDHTLIRPDPRADGPRRLPAGAWAAADARFDGRVGGGRWDAPRPLPDRWPVDHDGLRFTVGCAPSGHTGLFPEQAAHWRWMREALSSRPADVRAPEILNLFGYTGGASVALAAAGARVTHVDASRPAIGWARENAAANGLDTIRWIQEDARRFVDRARRRGTRYAGVLLDPPAYGRGPAGDWRLDRDLGDLLEAAAAVLVPEPTFFLVNVYSGDLAPADLERLLTWATGGEPSGQPGLDLEADELRLEAADGRLLPTGIYARWRTTAARPPAQATSTRPGARG
jgi:23S rRNA (cytosine1962-C5)-methyltransferase